MSGIQDIDFAALTAPFKPGEIEWRVGSTNRDKTKGLALAYMDARAVMERLDEVCGPANWACRYTHASDKTVCEIGIRIDGEWIWKADGAGDTQFEAQKGALSDAFKRAAFRWGIGRYLYDLPAKWVPVVNKGSDQKPFIVFADGVVDGLRASLVGKGEDKSPAGPLTSGLTKTQLTSTLRNLLRDLEGCTDLDTFEGMLADNAEPIAQCERDFKRWYYGTPGDADSPGLHTRIEDIRSRLVEAERNAPERLRAAG